jgi:kinetochore protein NDC80
MNPPHNKSMLPTARNSITSKHRKSGSSRLSVISNNPRSSLAPARSTPYSRGTPTLSEMMAASVKRTSMRSSGIGFLQAQQQQGSVARNRLSMAPGFATPSGSNNSTSRDTRPLRDKSYQAKISQETFDYLVKNKFEIEMRHPLTQKTLKAPTQKDFALIFQWLYKRLDPGYKFTRSIEHEVYSILKIINYPFLDSINKSQISAVGGQNWPFYLGMLHWLVELNRSLDAFDNKAYGTENYTEDDALDQIFIRYISKSYKAFLSNEDDYSEYKEEMIQEFDNYSLKINEEMAAMKEDTEKLEKKLQQMEKSAEQIHSLESKGEALEGDLLKFKAYIDSMERRKMKWEGVLSKIKEELDAADVELKEVQETKANLELKIKEQGLEPADIDRINAEREKLGKSLDRVNASLEEMTKICKDKESVAQNELENLEILIHSYNDAVYRLSARPKDESGNEIDLSVSLNAPLTEENLGRPPDEIVKGKYMIREIRPLLQKFRLDISDNVRKIQDEMIQEQDQLDKMSEDIIEKQDEITRLEAKLKLTRISHDTLVETMQAETAASNAEIEKMTHELQRMELAFKQSQLQLEQRRQSTAIKHEKVQQFVQHEREHMRKKVEQVIFKVTDFKVNIQESLEKYEAFVLDEWNKTVANE